MDPSERVSAAGRWGLVRVREAVPGIVVHLPYSTANNVTGHRLYPPDMPCLINRGTGEKLRRAQEFLRAQGYGLKVWDAYRPPEAQQLLYDLAGKTGYVADPKRGWGRHCSGTAVDVTLVDSNGRECKMPTRFDDFSDAAHLPYTGDDPIVRKHIEILQNAMFKAGFSVLAMEWWHYNDRDHDGGPLPPPIFGKVLGIRIP